MTGTAGHALHLHRLERLNQPRLRLSQDRVLAGAFVPAAQLAELTPAP